MKKKFIIPKNAKKVFQGVIYEVYQWKQKMFDGSFGTFERIKRSDTVTVIATVGNKIFIQNQMQPFKGSFVSLPGGRMDPGEKPLQAAKREFLEETGYVSKDISLWKTINQNSGIHFNEYVYIFRDCQKIQDQKLDAGEKIKCRLVSFEEFLKLSNSDDFRHRSIEVELLRMRLNSKLKAEFKKKLFY